MVISDMSEEYQGAVKYSEVDPTRPIMNNMWVVSLVRKTEGVHREHAFLILEGRENETSKIWFIDFVGPNFEGAGLRAYVPGLEPGKIRVEVNEGDLSDKLLFSCRRNMMDIHKGDGISYLSWNIPKSNAMELVDNIVRAKDSPPPV